MGATTSPPRRTAKWPVPNKLSQASPLRTGGLKSPAFPRERATFLAPARTRQDRWRSARRLRQLLPASPHVSVALPGVSGRHLRTHRTGRTAPAARSPSNAACSRSPPSKQVLRTLPRTRAAGPSACTAGRRGGLRRGSRSCTALHRPRNRPGASPLAPLALFGPLRSGGAPPPGAFGAGLSIVASHWRLPRMAAAATMLTRTPAYAHASCAASRTRVVNLTVSVLCGVVVPGGAVALAASAIGRELAEETPRRGQIGTARQKRGRRGGVEGPLAHFGSHPGASAGQGRYRVLRLLHPLCRRLVFSMASVR